ncbi:aminoacyl--tRNA ligase-related protein [Candidatus Carsonella ruddii]|uniref:Seryl-tRNA(Ser/Sec) synthetase n=1 Tax=Candidatus Carsonella ruddii PC isolate NHV TaxID=1202540 RepID=J3VQS8_CARRU|nr:aminoacyl--tRNA ligase-related protein [Candidatus Carsonella ruddii]AFP84311.1 seryl-tRNA synthetase [Candidatus Carsonella ruddii PC isolate NHV]
MYYKNILINSIIKKENFSILNLNNKIKNFYLKKKLNIFFKINFSNFNYINNYYNSYNKVIFYSSKIKNNFLKINNLQTNCLISKIISSIKYNILDFFFCNFKKIIKLYLSKILNLKFKYNEIEIPVLINYSNLLFSGQIPKFYNFLFKIENKNCFLIPTSEVILNSLSFFLKKKIKQIKIFCDSLCFRKESYNLQNNFGLKRQNQFIKIEIFQFIKKNISFIVFYNMCSIISYILKSLKIKFKIVKINNLEINSNTFYSFDFEVYTNHWFEISSLSLCLNKPFFYYLKKKNIHIINGSCFPIGRLILIILDIYRLNNRIIKIPKKLNKYLTELLKW